MGCDIHGPFIEVREFPNSPHDPWWSRAEFACNRNYSLFGALAGVRDTEIEPVTSPRGFPADASYAWRQHQDPDCHSHSWLTPSELVMAQLRLRECYGATNEDLAALIAAVEVYAAGPDPVRVGFCFDN